MIDGYSRSFFSVAMDRLRRIAKLKLPAQAKLKNGSRQQRTQDSNLPGASPNEDFNRRLSFCCRLQNGICHRPRVVTTLYADLKFFDDTASLVAVYVLQQCPSSRVSINIGANKSWLNQDRTDPKSPYFQV